MRTRSFRNIPEHPVLTSTGLPQTDAGESYWRGRRVLITGASGFSGRHLTHSLRTRGTELSGFDVAANPDEDPTRTFAGSLLNQALIKEVISQVRPEIVFHLAGVIRTDMPELYYSINAGGTAALLEAIARSPDRPRAILVSSSAVYGEAGGDRPLPEEQVLRPLTSYGHSKLAMEWIARAYHVSYEIPIVMCRPFNLVGPGLNSTMVLSSFARQIACAERGDQQVIRVGNLETRRDFIDVRDGVEAYRLLAERGIPGETYNVCSGRSVSIRDCLEMLLSLSDGKPEIIRDPHRKQRDDVPVQIGDPGKIRSLTGWEPRIPLEQSLRDLLEDWRKQSDACE